MIGDAVYYLFLGVLYLILIVGLPIAGYFLLKLSKRSKETISPQAADFVLLRLSVPKNNEKTPQSAEHMFASLHGIFQPSGLIQDHLSFEIASKEKNIQFYVWVPVHLKEFVEGQIYAQYPTVEIAECFDYTSEVDLTKYRLAGAEITLNKPDAYPIKTFLNFEVDPLAGITAVLSQIDESEEIWAQIIIEPIGDEWQKSGITLVNAVKAGRTPLDWSAKGILKTIFTSLGKLFVEALNALMTPSVKSSRTKLSSPVEKAIMGQAKKLPAPVEAALTAVETKITKLGFRAKIRVICLSKDQASASAKVQRVFGAFKQFNTTNLNGFELTKFSSNSEILQSYQNRLLSEPAYILNIEELASLYHLPNISVQTPMIVWAGSKKGEPPADLPIMESVPEEELTVYAKTNFRQMVHQFGIKMPDRRLHMYAIGKTGTGKSTMLENMIIDDMREGRGVAVVDPHGDLINKILDFVPSNRINDVILFSPADREYPVGFNVLENVDPDLKNIVASGVVGIFKKIFGESWGPRLEYILRNTILSLLDYPDATLLGVIKILVDKEFRSRVVAKVSDPVLRDFWLHEYEKYDPKFRTEAIAPIQNKVGQFLSSTTIRNLVGQPKSTVDINDIMDTGKILLLDLSIGKIGEDNSALLGAMAITKIQIAALGRARLPREERRDFYLYVDEFQNFATESFAVILSEARKYGLNLILTNQYIAQMPEIVAAAVFGNVGTIVSFRVGAADADALVKEYEPIFEANDLVNLDNYHIYVKMAIDGVTCPAFSAQTLPPVSNPNQNREKIIRASRERYGRPREVVEQKIIDWSSGTSDSPTDEVLVKAGEIAEEKNPQTPAKKKTQKRVEKEGKIFRIGKDLEDENKLWYVEEDRRSAPDDVSDDTVDGGRNNNELKEGQDTKLES